LSLILERDNFWWKNLFWKEPLQLAWFNLGFKKMDEIELLYHKALVPKANIVYSWW
jgi:hypothetical protein